MAYLKRTDVNSGNEVNLAHVVAEEIKKKSGIVVMPIPLLDSGSTSVFDFSGTTREFSITGIKQSETAADIKTFIDNVDDFISGSQNVGGNGLTEYVSDTLGLKVTFDNLSGTFVAGETITGGTSTSTAIVQTVSALSLVVTRVTGDFSNNEQITGGTSGATADVNGSTGDSTINSGNRYNVKVKDWNYTATAGDPNKIDFTINLVEK